MSESPFLFEETHDVDAEENSGDGRQKVVVFGALAAVVLGAGAFFFLSGGEEAANDEFFVPQSAPRAAAAAPVAKAPVKLPPASAVQLGRNPFKALYVAPAAATGGSGAVVPPSSTGTTAPITTVPVTTGGTAPIVVVSGGGATSPTTSTPSQPASQPAPAPAPKPAPAQSTVKLVSVSTKTGQPVATFLLDGKEHSGKDLDILAGKLLIKSIGQESVDPAKWFAVLQLGDGSPFEVHQNQEVVVQ